MQNKNTEIDNLISKAKDLHTNDIQTIICSLQIEIDEREEQKEKQQARLNAIR